MLKVFQIFSFFFQFKLGIEETFKQMAKFRDVKMKYQCLGKNKNTFQVLGTQPNLDAEFSLYIQDNNFPVPKKERKKTIQLKNIGALSELLNPTLIRPKNEKNDKIYDFRSDQKNSKLRGIAKVIKDKKKTLNQLEDVEALEKKLFKEKINDLNQVISFKNIYLKKKLNRLLTY